MSTTATTRILHAAANANNLAAPRSWVWPLPRLDGIAPCVVEPAPSPTRPHGIPIGYPGRCASPNLVPVFAANDGVVAYADIVQGGANVCIDHAEGWSTHYGELEHVLTRPTDRFRRRRKERVRAGDIIGHARRSVLQIRFGLSRLINDDWIEQDPTSWMSAWSALPWFDSELPSHTRARKGPGDRHAVLGRCVSSH